LFSESSKGAFSVNRIYILLSGTCPSALTMHTEELISWEETHKTHD